MRFSILIPVYNTEKYLEECLDSVFAQTFGDFEAVVVDDGSTDSSAQILEKYRAAHPDVMRVITKENGGLISARRAAVAEARGEFSVFLDSDDFIEPDLLESVDEAIKKYDADIVIFRFLKHYPTGVVALPPHYPDGTVFEGEGKKAIYRKLIVETGFNSLCMKPIRTQLLKDDPTDYTLSRIAIGEDKYQSLYPFTYARRVVYLDHPLYHVRVNSDSMTRLSSIENADRLFNRYALESLRHYMSVWGMEDEDSLDGYYSLILTELINYFSKSFTLARNEKERRETFFYDWFSLIPAGFEPYLGSRKLSLSKRVRLGWLYRRRYLLMRAAYMVIGEKKVKEVMKKKTGMIK